MGLGRPSKGITKKVSLTLRKEEWDEIVQSQQTVAAFLQNLMIQKTNDTIPTPTVSENESCYSSNSQKWTTQEKELFWLYMGGTITRNQYARRLLALDQDLGTEYQYPIRSTTDVQPEPKAEYKT